MFATRRLWVCAIVLGGGVCAASECIVESGTRICCADYSIVCKKPILGGGVSVWGCVQDSDSEGCEISVWQTAGFGEQGHIVSMMDWPEVCGCTYQRYVCGPDVGMCVESFVVVVSCTEGQTRAGDHCSGSAGGGA